MPGFGLSWALCAALACWVCGALWWLWWRTPSGWLTWAPTESEQVDGHKLAREEATGWWWTPAMGTATLRIEAPVIVLDAGSRLGLRAVMCAPVSGSGGHWRTRLNRQVRWLWVDRSTHPARWLPLRRALWAHRP